MTNPKNSYTPILTFENTLSVAPLLSLQQHRSFDTGEENPRLFLANDYHYWRIAVSRGVFRQPSEYFLVVLARFGVAPIGMRMPFADILKLVVGSRPNSGDLPFEPATSTNVKDWPFNTIWRRRYYVHQVGNSILLIKTAY